MNKVFFTKIREEIMCELLNSKESVKIAMAYLTDIKIIELLCLLSSKGINVSIIISSEEINFRQIGIELQKMINQGVKLYLYTTEDDRHSILHHKFCIIDHKLLINGSYNWTLNAQNNRENIIITDDQNLINKFTAEWDELEHNCARINNTEPYIIKSGFPEFDNEFQGFYSGSLTVLFGEEGSGKTSFIISLLNHCSVTQNFSTCVLTNNLTSEKIYQNLIKNLTEMELKAPLEEHEIYAVQKTVEMLKSKNIVIDSNFKNYNDLKMILLKLQFGKHIKLALIDELDFELTFLELKKLRSLAKQLNIPIIVSKSINKSKAISKINSISEIENLFSLEDLGYEYFCLLRPEIYNIYEDSNGTNLKGKVILKHNYGKFYVTFYPELSKIFSGTSTFKYTANPFQTKAASRHIFTDNNEEDIPF